MSDTATGGEYRQGDDLEWITREGENTLTKRSVRFIALDGPDSAVVSFGVNYEGQPARYSVRVEELQRPQSPERERPWWVPPPVQVQKVPEPPTEAEIMSRLEQRRAALNRLHQKAKEARDVVAAAKQLADRAAAVLAQAQAELRNYADLDRHAIDAVVHQIRHGGNSHSHADGDEEWTAREKAKRSADAAQAAHDRLTGELAQANGRLGEALTSVRAAAAAVLVCIVDREAETWRRKLEEVQRDYNELCAAAAYWPEPSGPLRLGAATSSLLANAPNFEEAPVTRMAKLDARQAAWRLLLQRLVENDSEADLEMKQ